ncbi:potassium channel family protein [Luteococcus japonicus]|uniref:Trk system potassium uptake protein TrkA n=1 Tax=Luteococcus japonicus LSP_Lj1 TaxID=1255658 RepID=A0A1R4I920_9ACTN|nr:TrkA family potassium uptake protein [Luteococcus japonicus]SJN16186.1 Trk system potassium uptake protein TrkA [Luteococcus japonicus LSP_Lj1]
MFSKQQIGSPDTALVVGLGRFGRAAARRLNELGVEVLGIDRDPALVSRLALELDNVLVLDATDAEALDQVGLGHVTVAVVGMAHVEASVVTVLKLKEFGIREVWAKASSQTHGEILHRVGADHVIYPEAAAGLRVAHAVARHLIDYFEFEDGFAIARVTAPPSTWERSLAESGVRTEYRVTVVGVKREGEPFHYAEPDTVIREGDHLIISGTKPDLDRFASQG